MRTADRPRRQLHALAFCTGGFLCALTVALSDPVALAESGPGCLQQLSTLNAQEQLSCVRSGALNNVTLPAVIESLQSTDGATDHRVVAALLERVRIGGRAGHATDTGGHHHALAGSGRDAFDVIAGLLPHQAAIYEGRDKWHVLRLRASVFATLSDIGVPDSALPMLVDTLAHVDERMTSLEFGAAVRAAGTLGPDGREFIPYLLAINERFAEEEFSLNRYELSFPRAEATTVQLETVRALAAIAGREDAEALIVLRAIADSRRGSSLDSRLIDRARKALETIERRADRDPEATPPIRVATLTPWMAPADRRTLTHLDVTLETHEGVQQSLSRLIDRPVLLTFFYSRCQNAEKCSTTMIRLAQLQRELAALGLTNEVRLLALTLEPDHDTPVRLKRYALDRGLKLGGDALAGRFEVVGHAAILRELDTPVSYNGGWVNTHGVESVLLDANGRLVRKYTMLGRHVLDDFEALLAGE